MKATLVIGLLTASLFSAAAFATETPAVDTAKKDDVKVDAATKDEVKTKLESAKATATPEQKAALKEKLQARHNKTATDTTAK